MYKIRDYPYLAIRGRTLFPGAVCSIELLSQVEQDAASTALASKEKTMAIFSTASKGEVGLDDLDPVGVLAIVRAKTSDRLELEVTTRVRLRDLSRVPKPIALVEFLEEPTLRYRQRAEEQDELIRFKVAEVFERSGERGQQAIHVLERIPDGEYWLLACFIASILVVPHEQAQSILASESVEAAQDSLLSAIQQLLDQPQKVALYPVSWSTNEMIAGEENEAGEELASKLRASIEELDLHPSIKKCIRLELDRLERFEPSVFEHQDTLARLEEFVVYPWYRRSSGVFKLERARKALDRKVYGHLRAKEMLLDLVSLRLIRPRAGLPLIILTGVKGLGQGALMLALAEVMGCPREQFVLPNEGAAEFLTGTARNLPSASASAVYRAAVSAGVMNPILHLISETAIDGPTALVLGQLTDLTTGYRFRDAYLDLPIDASELTIAIEVRSADMVPKWLRERSLVIDLEGYSLLDKIALWNDHLWPRALRESGESASKIMAKPEVVEWLVKERTSEVGVYELSYLSFKLARRAARLLGAKRSKQTLDLDFASACLGLAKPLARSGEALGVVSQIVLSDQGFIALESAAAHLPAEAAGLLAISAEAKALAFRFGFVPTKSEAEGSWFLSTSSLQHKLQSESFSLSLALALRSACLHFKVARSLAVIGDLGFGGELIELEEERERVLFAWSAGFKTVVLPLAGYEYLLEALPQQVLDELELIPVSTFEQAVQKLFG